MKVQITYLDKVQGFVDINGQVEIDPTDIALVPVLDLKHTDKPTGQQSIEIIQWMMIPRTLVDTRPFNQIEQADE